MDSQVYEKEKIKHRKKKSGIEVTAIECVLAYKKFLATFRLKILLPLNELEEVHALRSHFSPHFRFNMDQCLLPLVIS